MRSQPLIATTLFMLYLGFGISWDPSKQVISNGKKAAVATIHVRIPSSDETEEDIADLVQVFFPRVLRRMPTESDSTEDKDYFKVCVLVSFPTKDGDDGLRYTFVLSQSTDHDMMAEIQNAIYAKLMHRNVTEESSINKQMQKPKRTESNIRLFDESCYHHYKNGFPELPVYVEKVREQTGQNWYDNIERGLVHRKAAHNEIGMLVVTNHYAKPPNGSSQFGRRMVRVAMYDLKGATGKRIWTAENVGFGNVVRDLVRKMDSELKGWLKQCNATPEFTGCFYVRVDCKARYELAPLLSENRGYCRHGSRYITEPSLCSDVSKCNETCIKNTNWTECNTTCGDGHKWQIVQRKPSKLRKYCPAAKNPKIEKCFVECGSGSEVDSGHETNQYVIWPIVLITGGVILLILPFAIAVAVYWFCWRGKGGAIAAKPQEAKKSGLLSPPIHQMSSSKSSKISGKSLSGRVSGTLPT